MVLLHGLTCHQGYWLRVVPLLDDLRVVALDFRGHGLSEHRDSYGFADYERDLRSLLEALGLDSVPVAGHSLGGYVALAAATRDTRIRGVLALDVKSDWTADDAALAARARGGSQRVSPDRRDVLDRLARSIAPVEVTDAELELLAERSIEPADGGWRFRWDRAVLDSEAVDPFPFLHDVRCPTHVMADSLSDVMPPESARRFADAIPGATLELVEGAGHHLELERPELVAERIRELAHAADDR